MATKLPAKIAQPPLEFSRPLKVTAITQRLDTISIEATADECAVLATRFELAGLESLKATLEYRRLTGTQRIRIDGTVIAQTAQYCVATWEPVPETIHETFIADFTQTVWETADTEMDQPEIITEDVIDLGELVAQYFYLALEPYPRAAAAEPPPEKPKRVKKTIVGSTVKNKANRNLVAKNNSAATAGNISASTAMAEAATAVPTSALSIEDFTALVSNAAMPVEPFTAPTPQLAAANDETTPPRRSLFHQHLQKLKTR